MTTTGTLLGIWAHPDDECYLSAGLMADAARRGHRVVCVTATRGEAGVTDESRWPAAELAQIRERELAQSLRLLGVREHQFLGLADGACANADPEPLIEKLVALMIVSRELGIPCIPSVTDATRRIPDGALVEIDGGAGTVTILELAGLPTA